MVSVDKKNTRANSDKRTVLFVGSFLDKTSNGTTGGQMFACKSLINSKLSENIIWVLVDSTAEQPEKSLPIRTIHAAKRIARVCYHLLTKKIDTALIFTAHGASFLEKGSMCLIASFFNCKTIIAPRSGLIVNDIRSSFRRYFIRLVFNRVSLVVCQSPHWRNVFESVSPNAKYTVIHNWIALNPLKKSTQNKKNNTEVLNNVESHLPIQLLSLIHI